MDIAGRDTLVPDMFTAIKLDNERTSVDLGTFTDDYARTLWNPADKNNITKAVFATTSGATTISETAAPNAKSGAKGGVILVGNTGGDTLEGGDGRDLIAGGDGIDTLKGGKEKDFLFGGANNDTLQGGLGADVMDGGSGIDLADYTDFATGSTLTLGKGDYNNFGLVTFKLTDSATGDIDILFSVEEAKLGAGADTIKIDPNLPGTTGAIIKVDGGGATGPVGDTLDFSLMTTGVKLIGGATPDLGVSLLANSGGSSTTETSYREAGPVTLNVHSSTTGAGNSPAFTNFETIIGTSQKDVFNLSNIGQGGVATVAEQAQIDAAYQTFYSTVAGSVPRSVYDAAVSTLYTTLGALAPYQQELLVDGGDGKDTIKGSDSGVSTLMGGAGVDILFGSKYGSTLDGGADSDWLIADGLESHLIGGAGADIFSLGNKAFVDDAASEDFATWAGFRMHGGVQQWWMENGFAYYSPATSLISGALGAFGSVFTATATAVRHVGHDDVPLCFVRIRAARRAIRARSRRSGSH